MEFHCHSFCIMIFLTFYLQVYHITGYYIRHKHYQVIHFRQSFSFGSYICYRYLL